MSAFDGPSVDFIYDTIKFQTNTLTFHSSEIEKFHILIDNSVNIIMAIELSERVQAQIMLPESSANTKTLHNT